MFKEWSLNMQESIITQQFSDAFQYSRVTGDIMEYLERIAFMRFSLEKTADIMYNNVSFSSLILSALLDKSKDICIAAGQSGVQHPALYLIKIIVRLHGLSSLKAIAKVYPWVIPASMKSEQV